MKATETVIEGWPKLEGHGGLRSKGDGGPGCIDALCDAVISRYPKILAALDDGGTGCIEGFGGLR